MAKDLITGLALAVISITANAQNIQGSYQPKADGQVKKQQVEYLDTKVTGENMVWDISTIELPDADYTVRYELAVPDSSSDIVAGTEQGTRSYYRSTVDSIMLCGYENNLTKVQYDRPELLLHLPLRFGNRHEGLFHGIMTYCEKMFMRIYGSYLVEVDGTGDLILPSGDTLRHVSRVHIRKLTVQHLYPQIQTEKELKMYVASVAPFTTDSIRQHLITDSLQTVTNTYRWYATGYRHPILECTSTSLKGSKPYYSATYYCSPEEQNLVSDEENEQIRHLLAEADKAGDNGNRQGNGNGSHGNFSIQNLDINVNGSSVIVNYDLAEDATVKALVCSVSGIVFRHNAQSGQKGQMQQLTVDCNGLHHGQYVLYLNVNGQVSSQVINL